MINQEGVHILRNEGVPFAVIIKDEKCRTPVVYLLTQATPEEIANLYEIQKKTS